MSASTRDGLIGLLMDLWSLNLNLQETPGSVYVTMIVMLQSLKRSLNDPTISLDSVPESNPTIPTNRIGKMWDKPHPKKQGTARNHRHRKEETHTLSLFKNNLLDDCSHIYYAQI